jgi:hypothetical protein
MSKVTKGQINARRNITEHRITGGQKYCNKKAERNQKVEKQNI